MGKKTVGKYVRSFLFGLLSFVMAVSLFLLSLCAVLEATVFNPDYILSCMNASNYFNDKRDEITVKLTDLGYASGLSEEFFDSFVDEVMISRDTEAYIKGYYDGSTTLVSDTQFKQNFNTALDEYIKANNVETVNSYARDILIRKAANIYKQSLRIPMFITLSSGMQTTMKAMPFVIAGLAVVLAAACAVLFFANRWKHRAVKYICYATSASFLSVLILPLYILLSGGLKRLNLESRALYNAVVSLGNSICVALVIISVFLFLVSLALFFKYRSMHKKLTK